MSHRVLSFQRRAARLLAADEPPTLAVLDEVITDGCAEALALETQISRLTRQREEALREIDKPGAGRAVVELGEQIDEVETRLFDLRDAIGALMRRRSHLRLTDFLADR